MRKLVVVHDRQGSIVSVALVSESSMGGLKLHLSSGHAVVELESSCDLSQEALVNIHHNCRFDVRTGKLVIRESLPQAARH